MAKARTDLSDLASSLLLEKESMFGAEVSVLEADLASFTMVRTDLTTRSHSLTPIAFGCVVGACAHVTLVPIDIPCTNTT